MPSQSVAEQRKSARQPGRPRAFDMDNVLDAALELFWTRGFRTTTTRDLESALRLRQSSIYNAFGSKQKLLESALDRYEIMTDEALLQPLEQSAQGLGSIDRFFVDLCRWVTRKGRRGCMLINMMGEEGETSETIRLRSQAYQARVRAALHGALARAAQASEIEDRALGERADLLVGLVLGLNMAARGGSAELESLLAAIRLQIGNWQPIAG